MPLHRAPFRPTPPPRRVTWRALWIPVFTGTTGGPGASKRRPYTRHPAAGGGGAGHPQGMPLHQTPFRPTPPPRRVTWRSLWIPVFTGTTGGGRAPLRDAPTPDTPPPCTTAPPRDLAVTLDSRFHGNDGGPGASKRRPYTRHPAAGGGGAGHPQGMPLHQTPFRPTPPPRRGTWRSLWIPVFTGTTGGGAPTRDAPTPGTLPPCITAPPRDRAVTLDSRFRGNDGGGGRASTRRPIRCGRCSGGSQRR